MIADSFSSRSLNHLVGPPPYTPSFHFHPLFLPVQCLGILDVSIFLFFLSLSPFPRFGLGAASFSVRSREAVTLHVNSVLDLSPLFPSPSTRKGPVRSFFFPPPLLFCGIFLCLLSIITEVKLSFNTYCVSILPLFFPFPFPLAPLALLRHTRTGIPLPPLLLCPPQISEEADDVSSFSSPPLVSDGRANNEIPFPRTPVSVSVIPPMSPLIWPKLEEVNVFFLPSFFPRRTASMLSRPHFFPLPPPSL